MQILEHAEDRALPRQVREEVADIPEDGCLVGDRFPQPAAGECRGQRRIAIGPVRAEQFEQGP